MNGYLLIISHVMDDLPVEFLSDEGDALEALAMISPDDGAEMAKLWGRDCTTPLGAHVIQFVDGMPRACIATRHFDE